MSLKEQSQKLDKAKPGSDLYFKELKAKPTRKEAANWNDPTLAIDTTNKKAYFKSKDKFFKWNVEDFD